MGLQRDTMEGNTQSKMDGQSKTECDWPWSGTRGYRRQGKMEKLSSGRKMTVVLWTNPWMNEMAEWMVYKLNASYKSSTWWRAFKHSKTQKSVFFHLTPCNLVINFWRNGHQLQASTLKMYVACTSETYLPK
jgi:hypothetical protein